MPKGFNKKAIDGFTQWMNAIVENTSLDKKEKTKVVEETRTLLDKGFPKVRR